MSHRYNVLRRWNHQLGRQPYFLVQPYFTSMLPASDTVSLLFYLNKYTGLKRSQKIHLHSYKDNYSRFLFKMFCHSHNVKPNLNKILREHPYHHTCVYNIYAYGDIHRQNEVLQLLKTWIRYTLRVIYRQVVYKCSYYLFIYLLEFY